MLTVRTIRNGKAGFLINCGWQLRLLGAMYSRKDVSLIEREGHDLATLLGGKVDSDLGPADAGQHSKSHGSCFRTLLQLVVLVGIVVGGSWLVYVAMSSAGNQGNARPSAEQSPSR